MPTYEYKCRQCGSVTEVFATISQKDKGLDVSCNVCGSKELQQKFGAAFMTGSTGSSAYESSSSGHSAGCSGCSGGNCSTC